MNRLLSEISECPVMKKKVTDAVLTGPVSVA